MKLREARAKGLIEAGDLAEKAKVSRANVYAIEAGRWLPNLATIRKISEALEIDAAIEATAQGTRRKKGPDL
jgi:DNA-binding XRE family transcriptional regulator